MTPPPDPEQRPLRRRAGRCLLAVAPLLVAAPAAAETDFEGAADARLAGELESGRPTVTRRGASLETDDDERLVLLVGLDAQAYLGDHVDLGARVDTGDLTWARGADFTIGGVPPGTEAQETGFLREAWVGFEVGDEVVGRLEAGKHRLTLGDGLLLDGYGLGASAGVDTPVIEARAGLAWIGAELRPSGPPLLFAEFGARLGDTLHLGLLWARDTGFAEEARDEIEAQIDLRALQTALARERAGRTALDCLDPPLAVTLDSTLHWLGATAEAEWTGGRASATWLTGFGELGVSARLQNETCIEFLERRGRPTERAQRLDVLGHAASAEARHHVGGPFYPGLFALWLRGDDEGGEYDGFLAIAPYPVRPALFFDVGATTSLRTQRAATPGVLGHGLRAVGPTLLFAPTEDFSADLTLAWLAADTPNPATGGSTYGQEVDVRLDLDLARSVSLFGEAAVARLGDFYAPAGGTHLRIALGVSAEARTSHDDD